MSDWVKIDIVSGCGGKCVYIDDHRVAGAKPLGGGYVEHTLMARKSEILKALKQPIEESVPISVIQKVIDNIGCVARETQNADFINGCTASLVELDRALNANFGAGNRGRSNE